MASTYLTRTPASAGSRTTWTWSGWIKRSKVDASAVNIFYSAGTASTNDMTMYFNINDQLEFFNRTSSSVDAYLVTNRRFRDTNAWYHIVFHWDSSNATAGDRMKIYVNGVEETSFATDTNPSLNLSSQINNNVQHELGANSTPSGYFDGLIAHVNFIDGTLYDPSYFGQTDATSGIWKPKLSPSVTYGTNGFFLKFGNAGSLGTDSSGNGNNFTVANGTPTQTLDTPSNVFATWNPLDKGGGSYTFANGNTRLYTNGGVNSTLAMGQGKYYAEFKMASDGYVTAQVGVGNQDNPITSAYSGGNSVSLYVGGATLYVDGSSSGSYGSAWTYNDIMQIAVDLDNHNIYFGKNGSWWSGSAFDSSTPSTAVSISSSRDNYVFRYVHASANPDSSVEANFGNGYFGTTAVSTAESDSAGIGKFEYSVPSGYYALCTKNIADYG